MQVGELYEIQTADGLIYSMTDGKHRFVVATLDNAGLPPVEYFTRRPYKSDRVIETGFRLSPRSFSVQYQYAQDCGRDDYWTAREQLLNACRPNRNGALTLVLILADGTKRAITARALTPVFPSVPVDQVNEWTFLEVLQFEANDPVWFHPDYTAHLLYGNTLGELAFPITFDDDDIYFGAGAVFGSLTIPYVGTWYAYPIITVTPPFTSVRVNHNQLSASIEVLRSLSTASLILDLENNTIQDSSGNDLSGHLTPDSDLQAFRLEPDPVVADGDNTLTFTIPGSSIPSTSVLVSYRLKYIGI